MKVKLSPASFLCFFCLVFLIHEIHDWAHFWVSTAVCGCLGNRAFDSWVPCTACDPGRGWELALAWLAGPLINYLAIWTGWGLMQPDNPPEKQSLGFTMVFAALPFPRILAALAGGGDETAAFRQLFQRPDGSNHYIVAGAGLLVVLLLCMPPLIRAFMLVTGWVGRAIMFPAFLVLPAMVDRWLVHGELNRLLASGVLSRQILRGGAQLFVFVWISVLLVIYLLIRKRLEYVLEYRELNV